VGDGCHTLFSWDPWLEGGLLKSVFSRLIDLADNKMVLVAEMSILGWREDDEAWKWRRRLLAWEEEQLREFCVLLNNIVL
jgi:hypothetical protein